MPDKGGGKKTPRFQISKAPPGIAEGRLCCFTVVIRPTLTRRVLRLALRAQSLCSCVQFCFLQNCPTQKAAPFPISKAPPGIAEGRLCCFNVGSGLRSHAQIRSIIGDEALNFRVRNGAGCTRLSMEANKVLVRARIFWDGGGGFGLSRALVQDLCMEGRNPLH